MFKQIYEYPEEYLDAMKFYGSKDSRVPTDWFFCPNPCFLDLAMSPSFPLDSILTNEKLSRYEKYFSSLRDIPNPSKAPKPYLGLIEGAENTEENIILAKKNSWILEEQLEYFLFWNSLISKPIIDFDYRIEIGSYLDEKYSLDHWELVLKVFGNESLAYKPINQASIKRTEELAPAYLVNVFDGSRIVATSALCVVKNLGWMFSACVDIDYQSKALWKLLVYARQRLAFKSGVKLCFLQTVNERIKNSGQSRLDVNLLTK